MHQTIQQRISEKPLLIGLIFDLPKKLERSNSHPFPPTAEAEWETTETIQRITCAWKKLGYEVVELPVDKNFLSAWNECHATLDLVHTLVEGWGSPSREAWIPSLCELSGVPYIGTNPFGQCLAMRKSTFKMICRQLGVPTPEFYVIQTIEELDDIPERFLNQPHFIKPDCEGSGMGIDARKSIARSKNQTAERCKELLQEFPDGLIIEELLTGIELTSAFVGHTPIEFLPVAQIEVPDGVYGLANKSKDEMSEKVTFPPLSQETLTAIQKAMSVLQRRAGLEDFTRFDWKLNDEGTPLLLEANPLAGLSYYYSVLPKMAEAAGYTYESFLRRLAESALQRKNDRRFWYGRSRVNARGQ